jgi:hypothetical protein
MEPDRNLEMEVLGLRQSSRVLRSLMPEAGVGAALPKEQRLALAVQEAVVRVVLRPMLAVQPQRIQVVVAVVVEIVWQMVEQEAQALSA